MRYEFLFGRALLRICLALPIIINFLFVDTLHAGTRQVSYGPYTFPIGGVACQTSRANQSSYLGITTIVGKGLDVNCYIANKISRARTGDIIRLNYYIIEYKPETKYFYDALKQAADRGATIELVSEVSQTRAGGRASNDRAASQSLFLFGNESGISGVDRLSPKASVVLCKFGCRNVSDSGPSGSINHSKTVLLEIRGQRNIIISTANIRKGGETDWQAAIDIDAKRFAGHWEWWGSMFSAERCLAMGNTVQSCGEFSSASARSYSSQGVTSYGPSPETSRILPAEWLLNMSKPAGDGCSLKIAMGSASANSASVPVFRQMVRLAKEGCHIDFIHGGNQTSFDSIVNWFDSQPLSATTKSLISINIAEKMHAKMILWSGLYNGVPKKYSWVGSMNFTKGAIRKNDETMLRVRTRKAFDNFSEHFANIKGALPQE